MVGILNKVIKKAESALGLEKSEPPAGGPGGARHTPFTIRDGDEPKSADTFLGALGKIGKVEAFGSATKGLNVLVKTAEAGGPGLTKLINSGANGVMNTVLGPSGTNAVLGSINRVNPSQVNKAVASSNRILDDIKNGDFSYESVPKYTGDFANVIKTGLRILKGFGKAPEPPAEHQSMHSYAKDLVDGYGGVKLPFRYVVTFQYRQNYTFLDNIVPSFLVKSCDRPQVEFDAEDINMYNVRTKVIKKTTFNPINMAFYDDQLSHVLTFCNVYLNHVSPTTNYDDTRKNNGRTTGLYSAEDAGTPDAAKTVPSPSMAIAQEGGTIKLKNGSDVSKYAASLGAFAENTVSQSLLESITIYHLYQGGGFCDIYKLTNPKILQMQMDPLNSASSSEGNSITLSWHYDTYSIQTYVQTDKIYDVFQNNITKSKARNYIRKADLIPGSDMLTQYHVDAESEAKQEKLESDYDDLLNEIETKNAAKLGLNTAVNGIANNIA